MRFSTGMLRLVLAPMVLVSTAFAEDRGSAEEAKALADKGLAFIKTAGLDKALDAFTNNTEGKWKMKDLYVFVNRFDGTSLAHGQNKNLIGKNVMGLKDPAGKAFIADFTAVVKEKGHGWVSYQWLDPVSNRTLVKSTFVTRIPGQEALLGVGIYGAHSE